MKYALIDAQRGAFDLSELCRVVGVSISGYPAWQRGGTPCRQCLSDAQLLALIEAIHAEVKGAYGSPRLVRELRARGFPASKARVERLMRDNGIRARHKRRYKATTDCRPPDLVVGRLNCLSLSLNPLSLCLSRGPLRFRPLPTVAYCARPRRSKTGSALYGDRRCVTEASYQPLVSFSCSLPRAFHKPPPRLIPRLQLSQLARPIPCHILPRRHGPGTWTA